MHVKKLLDAFVEQASSSTAQDGTAKEAVSSYQALVCYIISFHKPASIVSTPIFGSSYVMH